MFQNQTAFSMQKSSQAVPTTTIFQTGKITEAKLCGADMDDWWAELLPFSSFFDALPPLSGEHALSPP